MNNKQLILLLLLVPLFINLKCRKDDTPQGYYFQCKLDGSLYITDGFCSGCKNATLLGDTLLSLSGKRSIEIILIGIFEKQGIKEGAYVLNNTIRAGIYDNSFTLDQYSTDTLRIGQLTINRLDKVKKEIEGTFYFKAYNPVQDKIVNISEGKFRLNYKTY